MNEDRIDINTYIAIILRRRWLILILFLATFLSTLYFTFRKPPVYEAKATIVIKSPPMPITGLGYAYREPSRITNHTLILKSDALLSKVAESFTSAELESIGTKNRENIMGKIRAGMIITPIKNANIIEIKCKANNPFNAALFANKIAKTYIQFNIEDRRREATSLRKFTESQLHLVETSLRKSEEKIRVYQKAHKVFGLSKETEVFISQLTGAQTQYEKARIERMVAEKNLEAVKSQLTSEQREFLESSTNISLPLLEDLKKSLSNLENTRASLLIQGHNLDDPKIKEIDSKIEAIKKTMNETIISLLKSRGQIDALSQVQNLLLQSLQLQIEIEVAKAKENAYKNLLNQYEGKFNNIPDNQIEFARLERQRKANEKIYMMLLEKAEEARISEATEIGTVSMLDRAMIPRKQIWKSKMLNIILGFIMGLIVSLGVAFVIEYFDTSIKGVEDIEKILKLPVFASIPSIMSKGKRGEIEEIEERLITHYKPRSPISEAYRSLRTNLQFASVDGHIKTVVITSPAPREGKTLTASNLAIIEAQAGLKTLLLDTDLRRPMIHNLFNLNKENGISRVLTGEIKLNEAIKKTGIENLYIITSGPIPPNPSELLGSNRMKEILKALREKFDFIVMDSPPMIAVTDPVIIGQEVDGIIFVIRSGITSRDIAEKCKSNAEYAKIKILGTVLNDVDVRNIYGTYNYYYNRYYYYYSDEDEKKKKRHHKQY